MAEIRPFVLVQDWMFDLGLNISEVMAVAVIYGFTQGGEHTYHVTLLELRRWAHGQGMSEDGLLSRLAGLRDSKRIEVGRTLNDWWIKPVEGTEPK